MTNPNTNADRMDRLELIEALKHVPDLLQTELQNLPDDVLRRRRAEGEWSIKETVGHLRDMAGVWHQRLYMVWSMHDPLFVDFNGEASVLDHNYQEASLQTLLAEMRGRRLQTVDLLTNAVDWSRTGQQPGRGRRTLRQFAELLLEHDLEHIAHIRTLLAHQGTVATT